MALDLEHELTAIRGELRDVNSSVATLAKAQALAEAKLDMRAGELDLKVDGIEEKVAQMYGTIEGRNGDSLVTAVRLLQRDVSHIGDDLKQRTETNQRALSEITGDLLVHARDDDRRLSTLETAREVHRQEHIDALAESLQGTQRRGWDVTKISLTLIAGLVVSGIGGLVALAMQHVVK